MDWRELSRSELLEKAARDPRVQSDPELQELLRVANREMVANPLLVFEPHPPGKDGRRSQLEFIEAQTPVIAAFAGTRFGKSTVLGVCGLREALPREALPALLARTKRFDAPTAGWIMVPTESKVEDSFRPVFEKWCPKAELQGGSWGKAFNGANLTLRFKCGSTIAFKTYKQDASTLGGAALHWIGYDEPPPKKHREEGMFRLLDFGGYEMFAMTPLDTNTGYIKRAIFKQRESPDITVVRGSIHDNPTLDAKTRLRALGSMTDIYAAAREFGDFVDGGGLMYPEFERCVVQEPWTPEFLRSLDVVVGIDPGIRNAGIVWVGFDNDLTAYVFNEGLLQGREAHEYADFIHAENKRLRLPRVSYVSDPMHRERGKVDTTTVQSALEKHGIFAMAGQNSHEAGFDQMRARMAMGRFFVSPTCVRLRDEADDYVSREPEEGKDDSHLDPVKGNDHLLDACFIPGTLIATEHGERPIETVRPGERVWTRDGLRRVLAAAMTDPDAEVLALGLEDGRSLTGTGNHPIWVNGKGFMPLDAVRYGDMLSVWQKSSSTTGSPTGATPTPNSVPTGCTSPPERLTAWGEPSVCISKSGSTLTDPSRLDATFTTATRILSTTTSAISNASRSSSTRPSTRRPSAPRPSVSTPTGSVPSPRHGTHPQRDASGIDSTPTRQSAQSSLSSMLATIAASGSWRSLKRRIGSAPTSASPRGAEQPAWMTSTVPASSAGRTSGSTGTASPRLVRVRAVGSRKAGRSAVFNLTVEGTPEYFANGVLVHNCRYAVMERFWDPVYEDDAANRNLGWDPASQTVPPASLLLSGAQHRDYGPLGSAA